MARIVILSSPDAALAGRAVELVGSELCLGREVGNALTVNDPALSRRHVRFARTACGWLVEDLGSSNGTLVNGQRINRCVLHHTDLILLGATQLAFDSPPTATAAPPAPVLAAREVAPSTPGPSLRMPPLPPLVHPAGPPLGLPRVSPPPPSTPPALPINQEVVCPSCGHAAGDAACMCGLPVARPQRKSLAVRSRSRRQVARWASLAVIAASVAIAAGLLFWRAGRGESTPAGGGKTTESALPTLVEAPGFPVPSLLPVTRTRRLASGNVSASSGGILDSGDGLILRIPGGAFDQNRRVVIHSANVPGPELSAGVVGRPAARLEMLRTWDVDLGPETGLLPGEIEVALDVSAFPAERYPLLSPAIVADGHFWTRLPAERRGDTLVFHSRHLSPVTLLGLSQAAAVMLPIAAVTYLIYDRVNEFPSRYNEHAPFLSVDDSPNGFEVYWSRKVPGADPRTGFRDERGYLREIEKVAEEYRRAGYAGPGGVATQAAEIRDLKRRYLMPECVQQVERALVTARDYLKTRHIKPPLLTFPVYVVPKLDKASGYIHNPWSGRRYMLIAANLPEGTLNTTALHELLHHYQTGYVWLDRNGHLPMLEASALLMEREAKPYYARLGRPYNVSEGLALAQFIAYRHGLNGPMEWKEDSVRSFGYGLTWFLEYLRDEYWVGVAKKNRPEDFHAELLKHWGSTKIDAIYKSLIWAAGGSETRLASALEGFAQNAVLKGPVDRCGSQTPYGSRYSACPLADSPYAARPTDYGLKTATVDLGKTPLHTVGDDSIRPWSIQFLRFTHSGTHPALLAAEIPREWFPKKGSKRTVLVREGPDETEPSDFGDGDKAPASSPSAWAALSLDKDCFVYVVDTGQTGSGWVSSFKPARFFVLEPPLDLRASVEKRNLRLRWKPPASALLAIGGVRYLAYVDGALSKLLRPSGTGELTAEISGDEIPSWSGTQLPAVAMTTAVMIGKDEQGEPVFLESPRSGTVGGGNQGGYNLELSIDTGPSTVAGSGPCGRMTAHWRFHGFRRTFPVQVGPDGGFTFRDEWTSSEDGSRHSVSGKGTFRGKEVRIGGTFATGLEHMINGRDVRIQNSGTFEGVGKYSMNVWLGHKMTGRFDARSSERYCLSTDNNECTQWTAERTECSGALAPLLSAIESFTRIP